MYGYIHVHKRIHTHAHTHTRTVTHVCMYVCMYVCVYVYICIYIYVYTDIMARILLYVSIGNTVYMFVNRHTTMDIHNESLYFRLQHVACYSTHAYSMLRTTA